MNLKWVLFQQAHFSKDMKHVIRTRWLANPDRGHSQCSHILELIGIEIQGN